MNWERAADSMRANGWACWFRPGELFVDADGRYQLKVDQ